MLKEKSKVFIIHVMKFINKLLNDANEIIFMDFEGTQLTQEIIAIGAIKIELDNKKRIKKTHKPFKIFIRAEGVVGPVVEHLTGINDLFLFQHGDKFVDAIKKFKNYCGINLNQTVFMTYGNFDMRLLHQTSTINHLDDDDFIHLIYKKNIDFSNIVAKFCRSSRNEMLSLFDALKKFEITPTGDAHDPQSDAINLSLLYNAFLTEKRILKEEYLKVLLNNPHLPAPIYKIMKKIVTDGVATTDDLSTFIDEEIK